MRDGGQAPPAGTVLRAIAGREIRIAARRRLVKLLFLFSILPPIVFTIILVVRIMAEQATGAHLDWDPLLRFLQFQALPVALLALGLGTPSVARDRAEDVLFLYATRPVLPWQYALGKLLAVAVPAVALMLLPGILIALLRLGVAGDLDAFGAATMIAKLTIVSVLLAWGYAGVTVGSSAATKRARWALLIALAFFVVPDGVAELFWRHGRIAFGPGSAVDGLLETFFDENGRSGLWGILVLTVYGTAGLFLTTVRVRREMIP